MTILTLEEAPETNERVRALLPAGEVFVAQVLDAEERDSFFWIDKDDHSQGKQREVSFKFKILDEGEFFEQYAYGKTSTAFNMGDRCKLRLWVEEILAIDELTPGFELDLEMLIGNPVNIVIGHNTYNDKKTGLPKTNAFVESVLRYTEEDTVDSF